MKHIAVPLLAIVLSLVPASVRPLGLGEVELLSRLNQPLEARIPLHALGDVDRDSLRVALGTDEQFRRAGIERPFLLTSLRFAVRGEGRDAHIAVTTRQAVAEPFLNFLLDVRWSNGRLLREYTLLLDPPVYGAAIASHVSEAVSRVATPPPPPLGASPATPSPPVQPPTRGGAPAGGGFEPGGTYGPVRSTDTLWSLADRFRGDSGVSIQQMMLVMLRLNPEAFGEGNVNLLREGAILRIPTRSQIDEVTRTEALAEVQRQHAAWQDFRRTLGSRAVSTPAGVPAAAGPGGTPARAGTETAPAQAPADGQLRLVSGGTAQGGVGTASGDTADISALRAELERAREDADASRREAEEFAGRVEETEAIIQELERLVTLRDADLAALQQRLQNAEASLAEARARAPAAAPESPPPVLGGAAAPSTPTPSQATAPAAAGESGATPAAAPTSPREAPAPRPVPLPPPSSPAEPSGIIDLIRAALGDIVPFDPLLLIGGAILVIVIAVVGVVFSRRRKAEAEEAMVPAPVVSPLAATPAVPAQDAPPTPDATQIMRPGREDTPSTVIDETTSTLRTQIRQVDEDPLAEVNVYLAYERFEQAEGLVKDAIEKHPDRPEYRLKLLEIYHAAKNAAAFAGAAALLREAVGDDHEMMQTAHGWWSDLAPSTDLLAAGAESGSDVFDVTAAQSRQSLLDTARTTTELPRGTRAGDTSGAVDFDLGFEEEAAGGSSGLDFDLDGLADLDADDEAAAPTSRFDRGITLPVEDGTEFEATRLGDDTGLDFAPEEDITLEVARPTGDELVPGADTELNFDVDVVGETDEVETAAATRVGSDSELDFDLGRLDTDESTASSRPAGSTGTGDLDLDLDLDTLAETSELPTLEGPDEVARDLDFDLELPEGSEEQLEGLDLDFDRFGAGDEGDGEPRTVEPLADGGEPGDELEIPTLESEGEFDFDLEFPDDDPASPAERPPVERVPTVARAIEADDEDGDTADTTFGFELAAGSAAAARAQAGEDAALTIDEDFAELFGEEAATPAPRRDVADERSTELDRGLAGDDEVTELGLEEFELEPPSGAGESGLDFDLGTLEDEPAVGSSRELDFDFDGLELEPSGDELVEPIDDEHEPVEDEPAAGSSRELDFDFDGLVREPSGDEPGTEQNRTLVLGGGTGGMDEVQTKLDLAQAYLDMGDSDGAKGILAEVMSEGNPQQRGEAETLLRSMG